MNKNNTISKVITGGVGINDLDIKNKLQTKNLVVSGTLTLPNNSITISQVSNLQDSLNSITPLIDANTQNIANLQQATTNISYGGSYTNIPNLYSKNNLLIFDSSKQSNTDILSTLNTQNSQVTNNTTNISTLRSDVNSISTKTSGITIDGSGKTNIVELSVSNHLTVYDPVGGYKDIIYTLDSQQDQITANSNDIKR